ncbi:hypothetical protein [Trinickia sp.]|uniref:hypothetical protein n=1 Tax=Trinickia sp. TaxID=2571163 RepID=UPI003F818D0F
MIDVLEGFAARAADQGRAAQWAAQSGIAFALEKRKVDGRYALTYVEGHVKTELINALRGVAQHLRP